MELSTDATHPACDPDGFSFGSLACVSHGDDGASARDAARTSLSKHIGNVVLECRKTLPTQMLERLVKRT